MKAASLSLPVTKGRDSGDMLLANTGFSHVEHWGSGDTPAALHSEISPGGSIPPGKSGLNTF